MRRSFVFYDSVEVGTVGDGRAPAHSIGLGAAECQSRECSTHCPTIVFAAADSVGDIVGFYLTPDTALKMAADLTELAQAQMAMLAQA